MLRTNVAWTRRLTEFVVATVADMRKHALHYEPVPIASTPWTTIAWRIVLLTIAFPIVLMALFAPRE